MRDEIAYGRMLAQTPEPLPDRDGEPHKVPVEPPPEPPDPNPIYVFIFLAGRVAKPRSGCGGAMGAMPSMPPLNARLNHRQAPSAIRAANATSSVSIP